jgi:alpha-D-ribose 1-methylphosphonate 5-triphosphate diphosphatase
MDSVFRSERVLIDGMIIPADVRLEHDIIAEVSPYGSFGSSAFDLGDRLLVPGFIDLHSDAVEKEIEPRPGAEFPIKHALVELDKKLAMAGITTMFHAIGFNEESLVGRRGTALAAALIQTISDCNETLLTIDNLVHARYEVTSFTSVPVMKELIRSGRIHMLSLMDHSPGQGQFKTLDKWKQYHVSVYNLNEDEVEVIVARQKEKRTRCLASVEELCDKARAYGLLIASHDDDRPEKIDVMERQGVTIAEFPLNTETALYARSRGMKTGMGAPNVVRGKSQSGNISARELVQMGCCDFLCSDYHPTSMLQAVYTLHCELGFKLADAFSFITSDPAITAGLADRGRIAVDALADLVVIEDHLVPKVVMTIKSGKPVYSGGSCFHILENV